MAKLKKEEKNTKLKNENKKVEQAETKKKTKSQILNELKNNEDKINIQILNIGIGNAAYMNKSGVSYFDLEAGESEILSLKLVKEICSKSISFFKDYIITISNVFTDDFDIDNIFMYLGLDRVYKDIENYDTDFLKELILESEVNEFESVLSKHDKKFTKMMACKMVQLYRMGENISREKERVVCDLLNIEGLKF